MKKTLILLALATTLFASIQDGRFYWKTIGTLLLILIGLTACTSVKSGTGSENTKVGMPNPASKYCVEQGGKSEIRKAENGGSYGVCIFKDGSEEDEWEYFRKNNAK